MTTPDTSVCYAYSLLGSNQSPLAKDQNLSLFKVPVISIPTQPQYLVHLNGKVYLLGAKKVTLSC